MRPSSQFHTAVSWVTPKAEVGTDTQTDRHTECTNMTLRPSSHFHTAVSWVTPHAEVSTHTVKTDRQTDTQNVLT